MVHRLEYPAPRSQAAVEHAKAVPGVAGGLDDRGEGVAGQRGQHRRFGALADDIADDRRPPPGEPDDVIEVAPTSLASPAAG
jgi:hypothetical protein